jgi:hypothetical protein
MKILELVKYRRERSLAAWSNIGQSHNTVYQYPPVFPLGERVSVYSELGGVHVYSEPCCSHKTIRHMTSDKGCLADKKRQGIYTSFHDEQKPRNKTTEE